MTVIYLDNAATEKPDSIALFKAMPYLQDFYGNASSLHPMGTQAREAVEAARAKIKTHLHCKDHDVIFTSGATESNNLAILSNHSKGEWIYSVFEHSSARPSVADPAHTIPATERGQIDCDALEDVLKGGNVSLVSACYVSNYLGTVQPVMRISDLCHRYGAVFHCDATQAVGKLPIDIDGFDKIDILTFSGHKFGGIKGTGCVVARPGLIKKAFFGGKQEGDLRPGTENVFGIVAMSSALVNASYNMVDNYTRVDQLKRKFLSLLEPRFGTVVKPHVMTSPYILTLHCTNTRAETLHSLVRDSVCFSTGSACEGSAALTHPNTAVMAMGYSKEYALNTFRVSFSALTEESDIEEAAEIFNAATLRQHL